MEYDVWIKSIDAPTNILQIIKLNKYIFLMLSDLNDIYIFNNLYKMWIKPKDLQNIKYIIKSICCDYKKEIFYIF